MYSNFSQYSLGINYNSIVTKLENVRVHMCEYLCGYSDIPQLSIYLSGYTMNSSSSPGSSLGFSASFTSGYVNKYYILQLLNAFINIRMIVSI